MASKTAPTPAEWIAMLIEKGKALRETGVTLLVIGDVRVELAAWEPPPEKGGRAEDDGAIGALDDAATYGRRDGVPGFTRPNFDDGILE